MAILIQQHNLVNNRFYVQFFNRLFFSLAELSSLFASYGTVLEASVIKDYGFVVKIKKSIFDNFVMFNVDSQLALWHNRRS